MALQNAGIDFRILIRSENETNVSEYKEDAPQYCQEDGGVWNATGKWCTPADGSTFDNVFNKVTLHGHAAISWQPRSLFIVTVDQIAGSACHSFHADLFFYSLLALSSFKTHIVSSVPAYPQAKLGKGTSISQAHLRK
ncbi:uncharacterized protein UHOD_14654 [Ustilago sp. UG-2017b]|nr:uncharacterized protein UHOD_14654 [Ustilago sp. UG-2017b]